MPQNKENWGKKFEKLFDTELRDNDGIFPNVTETRTGVEIMEQLKSFIFQQISQAREEEKLAWLEGKRCHTCGKEIEPDKFTDTCADCFENN